MNLLQINRKNLEEAVSSIKKKTRTLTSRKKNIEETLICSTRCLKYLDGVLKTHSIETTPNHDSGEFLFFFKNKKGEPVLIEELEPNENFMPEMKRTLLKNAKRYRMKSGGWGYLIQRVYFGLEKDKRPHKLMVICFERLLFESVE